MNRKLKFTIIFRLTITVFIKKLQKMTLFLVACANCGCYMKGQQDAIQQLLAMHSCESKIDEIKKSAKELKAIVDVMFECNPGGEYRHIIMYIVFMSNYI